MMDILHVTESYGGGVTSAINTYAKHSSQYRHHLVAFLREQDVTGEEGGSAYTSVLFVDRSLAGFLQIRKRFIELNPDVIHIHSTYAGVFFRILPFASPKKVVYTPHGFAFLRNDGPFQTSLYRLVERMFVCRTGILAGCSRSEVIEAQRVGYKKSHELINVCDQLSIVEAERKKDLPVIGMVGRICEQKGYKFFAQVAEKLMGKAHFKWVGGGDEQSSALLRSCGVEITGWITRQEVLSHIKGLDLYFHTAAWEGFPISVLEAAQLSKPIVLREIASFTAEGLPVVNSVAAALTELDAWVSGDEVAVTKARCTAEAINIYHSSENLSSSLATLYEQFS